MHKLGLTAILACGPLVALADPAAWIGEAHSVATSVPPKLLAVLKAEIEKGGPEGAIAVCSEVAPKLAAEASQATGWQVRRVSLRNRNPRAVPDDWERAVLEDFDRRAAAGENPATLERAEEVVVDGKPVWRYMRALPTQELCLACHGPRERLGEGVRAQLGARYPADRAVGYSVGQIRGAMTIRKPQP
ncbi:Tll0287-like domain-containing protein [Azohydromonas sediminis]|uniref:Tll0287-like domain-containing protein n=1 Tax=Azohydromonas sediminis TaxID=2259674 RepID=UPI000E64BE77|nr:DUF3365 domain-containing protein [Azohydromonas sediminis]